MKNELEKLAHAEVVRLHIMIERWLAGHADRESDEFLGFSNALAEDFMIISPSAAQDGKASMVSSLRSAHGVMGKDFRIDIRDSQTRLIAPPLLLLTYEEWQIAAKGSTTRLSSALLRHDTSAPGEMSWVHLHEVWLP